MPPTRHARGIVLQPAEQVEVHPVPPRGVVDEVDATEVVVRIEAVRLVAHRDAAAHDVPRDRRREPLHRRAGVTARLEAVAVRARGEVRRVAVVEGPAVLRGHRLRGIDEVEAVIAVEPRPAAAEHVAHAPLPPVVAEAVDVAAAAIARHRVVVPVGVAVQHQVVRAIADPHADRHPVTQRQPLEDVVAALHVDADRLGVAPDRHLHAHHVEALEVQPRAGHPERVHTAVHRLHRRKVEHRPLPRPRGVADRPAGLAAFVQQGDVGEDPLGPGNVALPQPVGAAAQEHGVTRRRRRLRALHGGERGRGGPRRGIGTVRRDVELGPREARAKQAGAAGEDPEGAAAGHRASPQTDASRGETSPADSASARRRSCPQAASMSGPRGRRKCATTPRRRRIAAKASAPATGTAS